MLEKDNFNAAKQVFEDNRLSIDYTAPANSNTHAVGMNIRQGSTFARMGSIDAYKDKTIKEVSFIVGKYFHDGVYSDLQSYGYDYIKSEWVTINVTRVAQYRYEVEPYVCFVRLLDNDFMQVVFRKK